MIKFSIKLNYDFLHALAIDRAIQHNNTSSISIQRRNRISLKRRNINVPSLENKMCRITLVWGFPIRKRRSGLQDQIKTGWPTSNSRHHERQTAAKGVVYFSNGHTRRVCKICRPSIKDCRPRGILKSRRHDEVVCELQRNEHNGTRYSRHWVERNGDK